ncbi:MAG: hypothetical protein MAG715_00376 [Methanonatronarchaeales archaeon]|nr:hypothetical protein [Methanonatronarchaeales archaeon]
MPLRVSDVLEEFPALGQEEFVTRARKLMREEKVHELPVIDSDGGVAGVVRQGAILSVTSTKSNVTVAGYLEDLAGVAADSSVEDAAREMVRKDLDLIPVTGEGGYVGALRLSSVFESLEVGASGEDVGSNMSSEVRCCEASEPLSKVWLNMMESGYTGYPVVKGGRLVGMVTASDVIREGHVRVKRESRTGENARESVPVENIMSTPVVTAETGDSVDRAAEKMRKHSVGRLPVLEGEKVAGIIDRYDVIAAVMGD